jgi:hypothetical protein
MIEILMKNHLVSDSDCNFVTLYCSILCQEMTNNNRFTFCVGDSNGRFTISLELEKIKLVILNIIFSVNFVITAPKRDGSNTKLKGRGTSKSQKPSFGVRVRLM